MENKKAYRMYTHLCIDIEFEQTRVVYRSDYGSKKQAVLCWKAHHLNNGVFDVRINQQRIEC